MAICSVSDVVLICIGVAGAGAALAAQHAFLTVARFLGAALLLAYAFLAARRALRTTPAAGEAHPPAVVQLG